jgi:hypothetical protein
MKQWFWPDINEIADAKKVARNASGVAFFIAIVTAAVTFGETQGYFKLFGFGPEAYLDAALFLIVGIGIWFYSRIAAVAGLLLYLFEQYMMFQAGQHRVSILALYITIVFLNAIRATFDYHQLKKHAKEEPAAVGPPSILTGMPLDGPAAPPEPEAEPKKKISTFKKVCLTISAGAFLVAIVVFAVGFFMTKRQSASSSATISSPTVSAPAPGTKTFRMKSGETIRGQITMEDPDLYIVRSGGKDEVLARADIASIE